MAGIPAVATAIEHYDRGVKLLDQAMPVERGMVADPARVDVARAHFAAGQLALAIADAADGGSAR